MNPLHLSSPWARALGAVSDGALRLARRWRAARHRARTERALRELDVRTLRDIGLSHRELASRRWHCGS